MKLELTQGKLRPRFRGRWLGRSGFVLALLLSSLPAALGIAKEASIPETIDDVTPRLMKEANAPGVSVALIQNFEVSWLGHYGVTSAEDPKPVTAETIFEAASMSKPPFAFVVLRLVEEGVLDLDTPLVTYLERPYIEDEPLHERITARMVLSHTTGFPNWRDGGWRAGAPLPVQFEPGSRFSYSGEGFLFLQRTVEHLTGLPTDELMRKYLLDPLEMTASSYVWTDAYDATASAGHTREGLIPERPRSIYRTANTAFTLYTTPKEYSRFLIEMMRPKGKPVKHLLGPELHQAMLTRTSHADSRDPVRRGEAEVNAEVHFGLGWRMDTLPGGDRFYHSGSNRTGFRCYSEFDPSSGDGIVIMTNSVSGIDVWKGLMAAVGRP